MSYNGRIPVHGCVTSVRKSDHGSRMQMQRKRQEEQEIMKQRTKEEDEVARILAKKWAEEDRRKKDRLERGELEDDARDRMPQKRGRSRRRDEDYKERRADQGGVLDQPSRRRELDDDRWNEDRGSAGSRNRRLQDRFGGGRDSRSRSAGRRGDSRGRGRRGGGGQYRPEDSDDDDEDAEEETQKKKQAQIVEFQGGWQSVATTLHPSRHEAKKVEKPLAPKVSHTSKVASFFAAGGSDDEKEDTDLTKLRQEAQNRKARAAAQSFIPEPTRVSTASSVADVQMKIAQWKASLRGKAAKMPLELQQEVAAVMGSAYRG